MKLFKRNINFWFCLSMILCCILAVTLCRSYEREKGRTVFHTGEDVKYKVSFARYMSYEDFQRVKDSAFGMGNNREEMLEHGKGGFIVGEIKYRAESRGKNGPLGYDVDMNIRNKQFTIKIATKSKPYFPTFPFKYYEADVNGVFTMPFLAICHAYFRPNDMKK